MKTIGVLGGLGPQATMDFEERLHQVSQKLIPQRGNSGYPPLVVFYIRHAPILIGDDGKRQQPIQPDPRLLQAAKQIGKLADFIVITANGPHMLQKELEAASGLSILSMVKETLAEISRRQWKKVGVLGLGVPTIYLEPLTELGFECEVIPTPLRKKLDAAIFDLMAGQADETSTAVAWQAINYLRDQDVDGIIPGCTELPLLLGDIEAKSELVNPAQLLAEAAVTFAIA